MNAPTRLARTSAAALAAGALLAAAAACGNNAADPASHVPAGARTTPAAQTGAINVGISGTAFTGVPATVNQSGVTLTFTNQGTRPHMAAIAALSGGHTVADLRVYLAGPAAATGLPTWVKLVGGVDEIDPGHRGGWTGQVQPGHYALVSFSPDAQGRPEAADGLLAGFTVPADARNTVILRAGVTSATVTLAPPAAVDLPSLPAGTSALDVVNTGSTPRTVDVSSVKPGRTFDDVMREAQAGGGVPASLTRLGGTVVPAHGRVTVAIEPAKRGTTYVLFDIDHASQGAIAHVVAGG